MKNSPSDWILKQPLFQKLIQALRPVDVDLFASRLCHQIPWYISWQPDPHAWTVDAFQINWTHLKAHTFLPFSYIGRVLAKEMRGRCMLIIITSVWPSQPWYTQLLRISIQDSIFISKSLISKTFDRPEPEPTLVVSESSIYLCSIQGLWQQFSAEGLSDQTIDFLGSS